MTCQDHHVVEPEAGTEESGEYQSYLVQGPSNLPWSFLCLSALLIIWRSCRRKMDGVSGRPMVIASWSMALHHIIEQD